MNYSLMIQTEYQLILLITKYILCNVSYAFIDPRVLTLTPLKYTLMIQDSCHHLGNSLRLV